MMRSLYSGVSGIQNHQTRMDVVANNISNVNTNGFKKGRVTFQDLLSQTLNVSEKPRDEKGGVNPKQVGLGVTTAAIDTIHTQGAIKVTGVNTDLAIRGEGFFVLQNGEQTFFTRNGAFSIDRDGMLVNPANGLKVQGWMSKWDEDTKQFEINNASTQGDIKLPMNAKDPAKKSETVKYQCNLQKTDTKHETSITVYDDTGIPRQLKATMTRPDDAINVWQMNIEMPEDQVRAGTVNVNAGENPPAAGSGQTSVWLRFNNEGALVSVSDDRAGAETAPPADAEGNPVTATMSFQYDGTAGDPVTQNIQLDLGVSGEFKGITQSESPSTTKAIEQDGWTMGMLQSININNSGIVTGVYTNGNRRELAQVAISKFTNPGGLEKEGESMYRQSMNSGAANIGPAGAMGRGKILAGALEMSNVDLAEEFADMIVTQRGFQANSRSVTTSDQMLQELLSLKR